MLRARTIRNTTDLKRIRALPRRKLSKKAAARRAEAWTEVVALRAGAELRPWQGQLIDDAVTVGGEWASLPVGQGKTLPAEVIPHVLEKHAQRARNALGKAEGKRLGATRAVLIIPASLRSKTYADRRSFVGVWAMCSPPPLIVTREELAREENAYLLEKIDPEVLLIDESGELSNPQSAAVRRIDRFVKAKRARGAAARLPWPHGLWVVAMTGTPTRKTIMGYWHIIMWCLGPELAPVPANRAEAESWALALDEGNPRQGFRPNPGALGDTLEEARAWYLDRLRSTPGVLIVDEDSAADVPLTIRFELAPECPELNAAFADLRLYWESPSGEPVSDPLSLCRIEGDLGCGLFRYWKPAPPEVWLDARREVAAFIRKRIAETAHALKPLDTDAQVMRAHAGHPIVAEWQRVRGMFDPLKSSRTKWLSDATLKWAVAWMRRQEKRHDGDPCVVWCGGVEFAMRLSEAAGVPYYGRQGRDVRTGRELHSADPRRSMVCSWHANKRGFNLQAWRTHAIVQPPQSAKYLEQVFGRAHRAGQTEPVEFTVLATSGGTIDAFRAALREARFAKSTAGSTQKILRAKVKGVPELPDSLRWAVKDDENEED